jgi:hypothetical protein
MKRIIIYLACLAGLVLASSCSVHDTVMKRHYMKGYYVGKHHHANSVSVAQSSNKENGGDELSDRLELSLQPEAIESPALARRTGGEITQVRSVKPKASMQPRASNDVRVAKPTLHLREMIGLKKPVASDRDGLSLFWIVILVILILWAIGFLGGGFGLGGLINLLLVVALILLILWLLRII